MKQRDTTHKPYQVIKNGALNLFWQPLGGAWESEPIVGTFTLRLNAVTRADDRFYAGEIREVSFGMLAAILVLCVTHTDRNAKARIISALKATNSERKLFYGYLEKTIG